MKQPNFLFIMADQMTARVLPFYGHPIVKTPHLCRLAEQGVIFENAYCNSPFCAPSRFSMLAGRLLQALETTGLKDDTIIIFLSDHGEMLGERGLWYKMTFFEWSARVPMIFYYPARFDPRRVTQPISLVDILPTLVDIAGDGKTMTYADAMDGHSLLPWLEGRHITEPSTVYGEMLCEGAISPVLMIRRDPYKYVHSEPDPAQLYDLKTDVNELNNLADHPAHKETCRAFNDEALAFWDVKALHRQVLASQRRRRLVYRALRKGKHVPWDFQPFQDASRKYMRNHLDLNVLERTARFPSPHIPEPDGTEVQK